jgi:hypothetical protein
VLIAPDGFASEGFEYGKPPQVPARRDLMPCGLPQLVLRRNLKSACTPTDTRRDALTPRYHELLRAPGASGAPGAMLER